MLNSLNFSLKLKIKLNELDDDNNLPLDLALQTKQESIAVNLVRNHADVNKTDRDGLTLLHKAINRSILLLICSSLLKNILFFSSKDDEYSSIFLVENGAKLNQQTLIDKKTPLICLASLKSFDGMLNIAQKVLANPMIDVNVQDINGNTCLHCAIMSNNEIIFKEILKLGSPNMCLTNNKNETPLWLALLKAEENGMFLNLINSIINKIFSYIY